MTESERRALIRMSPSELIEWLYFGHRSDPDLLAVLAIVLRRLDLVERTQRSMRDRRPADRPPALSPRPSPAEVAEIDRVDDIVIDEDDPCPCSGSEVPGVVFRKHPILEPLLYVSRCPECDRFETDMDAAWAAARFFGRAMDADAGGFFLIPDDRPSSADERGNGHE